jgi:Rieske Fe-S protein
MKNEEIENIPQWRADFPIDVPQDDYVSRRDFTKFLMLVSLAFVVGQFWILLINWKRRLSGNPPLMEIAGAENLPAHGTLLFHYPAEHDPCVLVRTGEKHFVAFSQKCTHLSCPVIPRPQANEFHCPCHEGSFDLQTGRPLAGPPRRPLSRVRLEFKNGKVYASGVEGSV